MPDVKSNTGGSRRERARATRLRILRSAHALFVERGYAATTMDDIATEAGVAVQTVYYTFRTKSLLLRDVVELAGAGEAAAPPVAARAWMREALAETSGDRALGVSIEHGVDIYVRVAPLWPALHAAAVTDPEVDEYFRTLAANRRSGMGALVQRLDDLGYLRGDVTVARGTDLVFALFSHEVFLALRRDAGWPVADYKAWLWMTLRAQLATAGAPVTGVLEGLSFEAVALGA